MESPLRPAIEARLTPPSSAIRHLADQLIECHGDSVAAIVYYGSCLRGGDAHEGLVDLYVLVDSYRAFYPDRLSRVFNRLLPPNVYQLTTTWQDRPLRCKYAVMTLEGFERGNSSRWFHSYLWGRFAQPAVLVYARDASIRTRTVAAFAQAVVTFTSRVIPRLPATFDAGQLWCTGLMLSYSAELRAERGTRVEQLFQENQDYYETVTHAAIGSLPWAVEIDSGAPRPSYRVAIDDRTRLFNRLGWGVRRAQGKALSLLRLIKAVGTFHGGIEYIVWKLERHSGARIELTPRIRRYPLVFGWALMWRLYRRGIFR